MALTQEQLFELIDYLQGSCKTIDEACNEVFEDGEEILSDENREEIDQNLFECETCGWWFEWAEEGSNGGECKSCCEDEE